MRTFNKVTLAQRTGQKANFIMITGAFVLYLLCSISTPTTQRFNFLEYNFPGNSTSPSVSMQIGAYGYCTQVAGASRVCTKGKVPFLVDLTNLPGRKNAANPYVVGRLVIPLGVLLPFVTFLAFAGMATAFIVGPLSLLNSQGAAGLGQVAMIISFILFERTDAQIREAFPGVTGGLGKCVWMLLAACLSAGIALLFSIMGTAGETRRHGSLIEKPVYV